MAIARSARIPLLSHGTEVEAGDLADMDPTPNYGTVTAAAGAATLNKRAGRVTSEALTSATTYSLALTNSEIAAGDDVQVTPIASTAISVTAVTVTAGHVTIAVLMGSMSGTVKLIFRVIKAS